MQKRIFLPIAISISIVFLIAISFISYKVINATNLEKQNICFLYQGEQLPFTLDVGSLDYDAKIALSKTNISYSDEKLESYVNDNFLGVTNKDNVKSVIAQALNSANTNNVIALDGNITKEEFDKVKYNYGIKTLNITFKQQDKTGLNDKTILATDLMDITPTGYEISNDKINILEKDINKDFKNIERQFKNRNGEVINIPYCNETNFGWKLDVPALDDSIYDALTNIKSEIEIPFTREGRKFENIDGIFNDIGNTYIEISIDDQHLWYFEDGKCIFDCDVVTGKDKTPTPKGAFDIMELKTNETMRGSYGTAFAQYWLRLTYSGIGIHAADWRGSFGGNIYHSNGSHGCINVSVANSKWLYENIKRKTPVVIY